VELAVANAKIAEVKNHERALISNYGSLYSEYGGFGIDDLEKTECEKAQQFR
jgi:hypothetical protein